MTEEYSIDIYNKLKDQFYETSLERPMRIGRYEKKTILSYDVKSISDQNIINVKLKIEKFVGGGFAGQVYKVKILDIDSDFLNGSTLKVGGIYALKILIPPSNFSRIFRDLLYWIGFQGPFQLQVNEYASRSGALWQKFIRIASNIKFNGEFEVNDIHGTFIDQNIGSLGEISDWVEGRVWLLEADERLDLLNKWKKGEIKDHEKLGSSEFREKYKFMHEFVDLLHEVGAHEFARQYEWSTCKSQPNCLKKVYNDKSIIGKLIAVDFRAGLTLLPFLPMSPGDFKLIIDGLKRGSLVQFDRGNIEILENYVSKHKNEFKGMEGVLIELKECEKVYRSSIPDISHNKFRLLYDASLWKNILKMSIQAWKIQNLIDLDFERKLKDNNTLVLILKLLVIIPFFW